MGDNALRRVLVELVATAGALALLSLYQQLQDPTSPLRLRLDDWRERLEEWSIHARVNELIEGGD